MASGAHDLNLLAAYVEGGLRADERARVVAHLASCAECRSVLAGYARASAGEPAAASLANTSAWFRQARMLVPLAATVVLTTVVIIGLRFGGGAQPGPAAVPAETAVPVDREPERPPQPAPGIRSGSQPTQPAPGAEDLSRRRDGRRVVEGKTFRLVAGEWIDEAYDPLAALREVEARSPEQRETLIQRIPALRPFSALGNRVIVVHEGTVYKLGTDPLQ